MPDPDDPSSLLSPIRDRFRLASAVWDSETIRQSATAGAVVDSAKDIPRLLAAVEAALELHQPEQETAYRACAEHVITKTLHDRERFSKMAACPACATVPHLVCAHCECPNDEWPCPTYLTITTALAGEEAGDGG